MNVGKRRSRARRAYVQIERAESAGVTGTKILDAFERCFHSHWFEDITLDEVATRAGVTVRTVIRRFGSKNGLVTALVQKMVPEMRRRRTPPPGNAEDLVDRTLQVYEAIGDGVVRNLAQEDRVPELQPLIEAGRREHRRITGETFSSALSGLPKSEARRVTDLLVIATDVCTWKLLRRDMGRSLKDTRAAMLALVMTVLASAGRQRTTQGATPPGRDHGNSAKVPVHDL